ncbi:hypothetical protein HXZ66_05585 [Bacillus sp. A116_S68]|nr:hypothetical protein HXZ66_05585 [Bacillus sp. A116_S68]
MATRKTTLGIILAGLIILSVGGVLGYSLLTSPKAELAHGIERLFAEDTVQIESEFDLNITYDDSLFSVDVQGDRDAIVEMIEDLSDSISGSGTMTLDNEKKVLELATTLQITSDIHSGQMALDMPFHLYIDGNEDEMAIDLDHYVSFMPDVIDAFSYYILPNIPSVQAEFDRFEDNQEAGEFLSGEFNPLFMPLFEEYFKEKQLTQPLAQAENIFNSDEKTDQLQAFMIGQIFAYMEENHEETLLTEDDEWLMSEFELALLTDAVLYSFERIEEDEDMAKLYKELTAMDAKEAKKQFKKKVNDLENLSDTVTASFLIEDGYITENKLTFTAQIEYEGIPFNVEASFTNNLTYDSETDFIFYGNDRENITGNLLSDIASDITHTYNDYILEKASWIYWEETAESEFDPEEYGEFYGELLTEDDLWLISMIDQELITHEDLEMEAELFYLFVLDLEEHGLVTPGTSDYYYPN